jgi:acetyl esterase/lipase
MDRISRRTFSGRLVGGSALAFMANRAGLSAADDMPPGIEVSSNLRYYDGSSDAWRLDLAVPTEPSATPRPAIVIIHGGGWIEGDKSSFSTWKNRPPGNIFDFAKLGFVAATINYRLSKEAPYPAALHDCKCALRWLRAHAERYQIDAERIGVWGNSAGGHLALLLAMTNERPEFEGDGPWNEFSSRVDCAVSDSGPIDLAGQHQQGPLRTVVEQFLGGPPEGDRLGLYQAASPSRRIHPKVPPLMLVYGVNDEQVPVGFSDRFVADLDAAGLKDVSYLRLANVGHCPHSLIRIPWVATAVDDFFVRTLEPTAISKKP